MCGHGGGRTEPPSGVTAAASADACVVTVRRLRVAVLCSARRWLSVAARVLAEAGALKRDPNRTPVAAEHAGELRELRVLRLSGAWCAGLTASTARVALAAATIVR